MQQYSSFYMGDFNCFVYLQSYYKVTLIMPKSLHFELYKKNPKNHVQGMKQCTRSTRISALQSTPFPNPGGVPGALQRRRTNERTDRNPCVLYWIYRLQANNSRQNVLSVLIKYRIKIYLKVYIIPPKLCSKVIPLFFVIIFLDFNLC